VWRRSLLLSNRLCWILLWHTKYVFIWTNIYLICKKKITTIFSYNSTTSSTNCANTSTSSNTSHCWSYWSKERSINWLWSFSKWSCWSNWLDLTTSCWFTSNSTCIVFCRTKMCYWWLFTSSYSWLCSSCSWR